MFIIILASVIWANIANYFFLRSIGFNPIKALFFGHGQTLLAIFAGDYLNKSRNYVIQMRISLILIFICILFYFI